MKVRIAELPKIAALAGCGIETKAAGTALTRGIDRRILVGPGGYLLRTSPHPPLSHRVTIAEAMDVLQITSADVEAFRTSQK